MATPDTPALPHTWRPLGVRVAVVFFGATLVIVCAAAWFGFSDEIRDRWTFLQKATVVLIGVAYAFAGFTLARSRVTATSESLVVVNGLRRREFEWAEVVAVQLSSGAPWASLDLADGTTVSAMGIQGSDGQRAQRAVRELRGYIDG